MKRRQRLGYRLRRRVHGPLSGRSGGHAACPAARRATGEPTRAASSGALGRHGPSLDSNSRVDRPLALPPPPPPHVRRRRRPGARRAHAANAVEQGKVHHAYLFVGSRGTGKTSMAKILAACLNCENGPTDHARAAHCESCVAIANATSLDVIEMDAASNNSVDDIRDLREKVAYAPVSGRHKVYILDEAHMLSQQAWNAFLKTLEEPPPRTIFVLATTEAQKVLPTVVDRCHRFDFGRPSVEQVAEGARTGRRAGGDRHRRRARSR